MKDEKLSTRDIAGATSTEKQVTVTDRGADRVPEPAAEDVPRMADDVPRMEEPRRANAPDPRRDPTTSDAGVTPLFPAEEAQGYRTRWDAIQTGFVDEPRHAVEEADSLVADVMKRLADAFAQERSTMEQQWDRGDKVSTEDLRVALRRYRTFFQRLLDV